MLASKRKTSDLQAVEAEQMERSRKISKLKNGKRVYRGLLKKECWTQRKKFRILALVL